MEIKELKDKLCKGVGTHEGSYEIQKVEKVLAPFMQTLKKRKFKVREVFPPIHEELFLKRNPKEILNLLKSAFADALKIKTVMNETAELLKIVTKSKSVNLYLTDYDAGEIVLCPKYFLENARFEKRYPIGTYLAAHVAYTKDYVISRDILGDIRFPLGIPDVPIVKSVLCVPIITNVEENCIGVIELYKECPDKPYDLINLQICNALTAWMGIALEENKGKSNLVKEIEVQEQMSNLADLYFSGVVPFSSFVTDTVKMIKAAVNAEKATFYVFHKPVPLFSEDNLTADVYIEGTDDSGEIYLYRKSSRARFVNGRPGTAGYAARTGEAINVRDAYKDYRFDRKLESAFYRTRSILAIPIKNETGVLAVIKMSNCLDYPNFREEDIEIVQAFSCYICITCRYFLLDREYSKSNLKLLVREKLLDFHTKASSEDINAIKAFIINDNQLPSAFYTFEWDLAHNEEETLKYIAYVFHCSDILDPFLEISVLSDFLVRVKKCYRSTFYHNFDHAFGVFNFVFNILLRNKSTFDSREVVAILLAALCHDIDHTGLTNTYLSLTSDVTYKLYGDFCGEAHRYDYVMFLIQQTDLLANVSEATFQLITKNLKNFIMGFNLSIHFQYRQEITNLLNTDSFDWEDPQHRLLSQNMILICSENYASFKNFEFVKKSTSLFYKELYKQGDMEKSIGLTPLPMLDRNKSDLSPENQTILLTIVVLPVTEILIRLFPSLSPLEESLSVTLTKWNELLQSRGLEMWKINEALAKDKKGGHKITVSNTMSSIKTVISQDTPILFLHKRLEFKNCCELSPKICNE